MKSTEVTLELRESREADVILESEEFIGDTMMPVPERNFSKSSQMSDEGIEPDSDGRKLAIGRSWSLESASRANDDPTREELIWERKTTKHRVTRCCSSDSAVLSDEEQVKGWENLIIYDSVDRDETCEGKPRYWRTPSVVVSDYSDHSYVDEKCERSDPELEKSEGIASGTNSRASSCSCLDCDDAREFNELANSPDNRLLSVCGRRRHSDSCCACLAGNADIPNRGSRDPASRRNSCLGSPTSYRYKQHDESAPAYCQSAEERTKATNAPITSGRRSDDGTRSIELLDIPPFRKISDCSTNSSLSGDDFEVTELRPLKRAQVSGVYRHSEGLINHLEGF